MHGTQVAGSIEIARPVDEVFAYVADQRNEPSYNPAMRSSRKLTRGPVGVGTRFRATTHTRRGPVEMLVELTAYDAPRRLSSSTHLQGMDLDGDLVFEPVAGGTRMSWEWHLHPTGVLRWLSPVIAAVGRRNERRIWDGLKRHLEDEPPDE